MITFILLGIIILVYFIGVILELTGVMSYNQFLSKGWVNSTEIKDGEYYRVITSSFLHANFLHLLVNGYTLFSLGQVELVFGTPAIYLLIFILSGVGGAVLSVFNQSSPSVGASSGIFGLIGALLVVTLSAGSFGIASNLFISIVFNLAISQLVPNINIWGHIGGLVTGITIALGLVMLM